MKYRKLTPFVLAASMAAGSSMAALAADANGATGTGTLIPHVNKEVTAVTLPTDTAVATVFNYNVDPEQLIKDSGKLVEGTDVKTVTGNDKGVYFVNSAVTAVNGSVSAYSIGGETSGYTVTVSDLATNAIYTYDGTDWKDAEGTTATATISATKDSDSSSVTFANGDTITVSGAVAASSGGYSNQSDAVKFVGQNSVDVDVTVTAALETEDNKSYIDLVADQTALSAATAPALFMQLKVGSDTKTITSDGATAKAKIAGAPDNFEVTVDDTTKQHKYTQKASVPSSSWKYTTVQLIGETNNAKVPVNDSGANTLEVPKIQLTWTVTKHAQSYLSATTMSATHNSVTLSLPDGVTLSKAEITREDGTGSVTLTNQYTLNGTTLTVPKDISAWLNRSPAFTKMKLTFSDGKSETITFQ